MIDIEKTIRDGTYELEEWGGLENLSDEDMEILERIGQVLMLGLEFAIRGGGRERDKTGMRSGVGSALVAAYNLGKANAPKN